MKTGIMPNQGDIVLIPIPFTDLTAQKRRPVIVISNDGYNQSAPDVIVVAMTSNPTMTPYSFRITSADLRVGQSTGHRPGGQDLHAGTNVDRENVRAGQCQNGAAHSCHCA